VIAWVALALLLMALLAGSIAAWAGYRRQVERRAQRLRALTAVAERIDAAVASLGEMKVLRPVEAPPPQPPPVVPHPSVGDGLPGRAALVDAAATQVARARQDGTRLAAAVVRAGDEGAFTLARDVEAVVRQPVYGVGPRAVAVMLPGLGRADALGLLARIEAQRPSSGRAVELEPDEDGVDLVARLLGPVPAVPQED
jgi:hypothetical protein